MIHRLDICCLCEKVRDERAGELRSPVWRDLVVYMAAYRLRLADVRVSYTYCAACLTEYQSFLAGSAVYDRRNREGYKGSGL